MRGRIGSRILAIVVGFECLALVLPCAAYGAAHASRRQRRHVVERRIARPVTTPAADALGPPRLDPRDGSVRWPRLTSEARAASEPALARTLRASRDAHDSLAAWLAAGESDTLVAQLATIEEADLLLAGRDTARADSLLAPTAERVGYWQWPALRRRVGIALARRGPRAADSLLQRSGAWWELPAMWTEGGRAEWREERFDLLLRLGDTTLAIVHGRQTAASERMSSVAARVAKRLDTLLTARGQRGWGDDVVEARVEVARGERERALALYERAAREAPPELQWAPVCSRGEVLRDMRRYAEAREAFLQAESLCADPLERAMTVRERAEVEMDARERPVAESLLVALAAWPIRRGREETLALYARLQEGQGNWSRALDAYAASSSQASAFRAGLMALAMNEPDTAAAWFARSSLDDEGAAFWRAVLLRRARAPAGDSLLAVIAQRPGYTFYRVAARETLGVRGWPGVPVAEPAAMDSCDLRIAALLLALGRGAETRSFLAHWVRWRTDAPSLRYPPVRPPLAREILDASAVAYSAGWEAYAMSLPPVAGSVAGDSASSFAWSLVPWAYPPAFESAFAALPESAAEDRLDRALLRAVTRKESHFDPRARSASDALGLMQLKVATARDVARRLGERPPSEADLLDPARNVRLGSEYLASLLARFDSVPRALAAYNAGMGSLRRWLASWENAPGRELGGAALECELICRPETFRYVQEILAARAAYRDLRPRVTP